MFAKKKNFLRLKIPVKGREKIKEKKGKRILKHNWGSC